MSSSISQRTWMAPGMSRLSLAIMTHRLSISNSTAYRQFINRMPVLTNLHTKQNHSFSIVIISSDVILGTNKWRESVGEGGIPVVYLFVYSLPAICQLRDFYTELAQIQVIKWILL